MFKLILTDIFFTKSNYVNNLLAKTIFGYIKMKA